MGSSLECQSYCHKLLLKTMPIDHKVANGPLSEPRELSWTSDNSILYALGVGGGVEDPTGFELEFTTENSSGVKQQALPTQVVVTAPGPSIKPLGKFNMAMLLHGEQHITLHQPFPAAGKGTSRGRIGAIYDKKKAAVVNLETEVADTDGKPLWSARSALFIRGEGGWGGDAGPANDWKAPERPADVTRSFTTRLDQALLYRLNGDRNPLHSDPTFAKKGGFDKPILHGLCTYGVTGRLLLHAVCGSDPARFKSFGGQFASPVYPGETLTVHAWIDGDKALFQTRVGDRLVFDKGVLTFTALSKL